MSARTKRILQMANKSIIILEENNLDENNQVETRKTNMAEGDNHESVPNILDKIESTSANNQYNEKTISDDELECVYEKNTLPENNASQLSSNIGLSSEIVYNNTTIEQFDENIPFTIGIEQCTSDTTCYEVPHQFSVKLSLDKINNPKNINESMPSTSGMKTNISNTYNTSMTECEMESSSDNYDPENDSDTSSSSSTCSSSSKSSTESNKSKSQNENIQEDEPRHPIKRKKNIALWKKNVRKQKRLKGESYVGAQNIEKPARPLLPSPCLGKAKHNCITFMEASRREIYNAFRELSTIDDQRFFVINHIEQKLKNRVTRSLENSRRTYTYNYSLTVDGQKKNVCREFFMATLNITDSFIRTSLQKRSSNGVVEKDMRGKHIPVNKLSNDDEQLIREHILSFPAVQSHYCRSSSQKNYLDPSLNISIMYAMYKEMCREKNITNSVSLEKYRQIFREYNLGFFRPKKDQCKKCLEQKEMTETERIKGEEKFQQHLERKELARKSRDDDKRIAKENTEVLSFNFDLQAVLTTPKGPAGQIFYLRKLAIYNFTVYNLGNQDVLCYVWEETQGKRGSVEISSCIYDYILAHQNIKEVRMMSDGCGGQQKNSIFAAMCLQILSSHPTLNQIDHKFFETGHTEMECDSIHSKIEQKAKYIPVYSAEGWTQIIRCARTRPRPYVVKNLTYQDFFDFKAFGTQSFNMNQIPWRKVCWLRYLKDEPTKIFFKTSYADEDFNEVNCSKKGRPRKVTLNRSYNDELPISNAKFQDLQKMCNDLTIPKIYHNYYRSLKCSEKIRDCLPEPNASESDSEDSD